MAWHMLTLMEGRQREREREIHIQCAHGPSVCGRPRCSRTRRRTASERASSSLRAQNTQILSTESSEPRFVCVGEGACENVMHLRTCTVALGPVRMIVLVCSHQIFVHILPHACSSLLEYSKVTELKLM